MFKIKRDFFLTAIILLCFSNIYADVPDPMFDGSMANMNARASPLSAYVPVLTTVLFAVGAVVGILGGARVYVKWNSGDQDIGGTVISWGGSCLFLIIISTLIRAVFNI